MEAQVNALASSWLGSGKLWRQRSRRSRWRTRTSRVLPATLRSRLRRAVSECTQRLQALE